MTETEKHLADLRDAREYRELVERMTEVAVIGARAEGATWKQIGEALGITHQGARKRFMKLDGQAKALVGADSE